MSGEGYLELNRAIDSIRIGRRFREDLGDLRELADSIELVGPLQPVTISPDGWLICGLRRLRANELLGKKQIDVWVRSGISGELGRLLAEQHENELRKPYTLTEQARLYAELKQLYAEDAARRQQATRFGGAGTVPGPRADAREQAAAQIPDGASYKTLERVMAMDRARADERIDPVVRELAEREYAEFESDGKVAPHFHVVQAALAAPEAALRHLHAVDDPVAELRAEAEAAIARATAARHRPALTRPAEQARPYGVRALLLTIEETDAWWSHHDAAEVAQQLTAEQWERFEGWVEHGVAFRDEARRHRAAMRPAS